MTIRVYWTIDPAAEPARAEPGARAGWAPAARDVRPAAIHRYDHYAQIARAAALTGYDGLFIAHRTKADDSQIVAAAIARGAPGLLLIPEFPASVGSAVYAAKQAASFQRLAHDRLAWAIAPDAPAADRLAGADPVDDADLIARTEEFLHVARGVHRERPFSHDGRFFQVQGGGFEAPLNRGAAPTVFLSGSSEEALALSARAADVHLFDSAPLPVIRDAIESLDRQALAAGRSVGFGIRLTVAAREEADDPRLPADLAGTYATVADRLDDYAALGIAHFVLAATPSLEEAYRIGAFVLPRLRARTEPARAA